MIKKYFLYLLIYSSLGWMLERIINLIFYKEYIDNSVLILPIQPLYGIGIVMAIFIIDHIDKSKINTLIYVNICILICLITTAVTEYTIGTTYQYFYHVHLWNYKEFFTCRNEYTCLLPTSIFAFISLFTIMYIQPYIKKYSLLIPNILYYTAVIIFILDVIITFCFLKPIIHF